MHLTRYTDYCLRVLMYTGLRGGALSSTREIAESYDISVNHLVSVVHSLSGLGYLETVRGKNGGVRLGAYPKDINLGLLVRQTEHEFAMAGCFTSEKNCCISPDCALRPVFEEALDAFLGVLEKYTLADLLKPGERLSEQLGIELGAGSRLGEVGTAALGAQGR